MTVRDLFPTRICETTLAGGKDFDVLLADPEAACRMLEAEDVAGRDWCRRNGYGGYTSYASLDDLPRRRIRIRIFRRVALNCSEIKSNHMP